MIHITSKAWGYTVCDIVRPFSALNSATSTLIPFWYCILRDCNLKFNNQIKITVTNICYFILFAVLLSLLSAPRASLVHLLEKDGEDDESALKLASGLGEIQEIWRFGVEALELLIWSFVKLIAISIGITIIWKDQLISLTKFSKNIHLSEYFIWTSVSVGTNAALSCEMLWNFNWKSHSFSFIHSNQTCVKAEEDNMCTFEMYILSNYCVYSNKY